MNRILNFLFNVSIKGLDYRYSIIYTVRNPSSSNLPELIGVSGIQSFLIRTLSIIILYYLSIANLSSYNTKPHNFYFCRLLSHRVFQ